MVRPYYWLRWYAWTNMTRFALNLGFDLGQVLLDALADDRRDAVPGRVLQRVQAG